MSFRRLQFDVSSLTEGQDAFDALSQREWLTVNGIGGYASGTLSGAHTRRYHGYLVAMLPPPYGRMTILSKVEESVTYRGQKIELSANRYPNAILHPQGFTALVRFSAFPAPHWTYHIGEDAMLIKTVYLGPQKNTVYVIYSLPSASQPVSLRLFPLAAWKDYHKEMHPFSGFPMRSERLPATDGWTLQAVWDAPPLQMSVQTTAGAPVWKKADWWNHNIVHLREQERGYDFHEDVFCPAIVDITLQAGEFAVFVATIEKETPSAPLAAYRELVSAQRVAVSATGALSDPAAVTFRSLALNADQFLITSPDARLTLLAGYPWFTDWGRDTMIALPGICLATGRYDAARAILQGFAGHVSEGMIPNRFPDAHTTPDYNTVDATLWFVHACDQYYQATGDTAFHDRMLPILEEIVRAHRQGTRYGIKMDTDDCLLACGEADSNLTWMDAKVNGVPVTPRIGKPVEVNALWINALAIVGEWYGDAPGLAYQALAKQASLSFVAKFVRADGLGLYDVIPPEGTPDASIRPNQVIAAALPRTPLNAAQLRSVLEIATRDLLTPFGLRSLSPQDPAYQGRYQGGPNERDSLYHQGTVWAWLIGVYIDLYRKVNGPDADISALTAPLLAHLTEYGVGGIAEVFNGDAPHLPSGCPWQAWSVAELLRVLASTPAGVA